MKSLSSKYRGHCILLVAMSCCLECVPTTEGFSRTDGYNEYMVELSSALSVLFTTQEGYYQHVKAIISAFGNVQYYEEISLPLGGTLSVLQKVLITLEGKMDDKPPSGIVHGFSVAFIIFICGTDDIPFGIIQGISQESTP